ncbi:hypothetical protein F939_01786 [Acinetobacter radioresistens DSM 6976 = NBRC 102413 = CIP 103788]|uniref:hypothetical protein n=1 Tax=Acinetobacter radioresistens TaxID=40216 RepID=UPI00028E5571|nr:hypothetical protein [Acinetobacter radioresistens]ENV89063.1 hypothetical protein F939_01786 [Acinetobacter radioresistens DSM 6976 = NBRC 102413 = CIP 103788]BBL20630.1 hypothetical protein ACRAD_13010 [Acinetobacter radioresistens DSM 6976 = NBRC 102413 = CIP 103788]BBL20641.1 hypothetical protein ACRAD_13120 [Acinetobacter radioresistens DSM 6976 = NBRC 102413 = CIP 103788]
MGLALFCLIFGFTVGYLWRDSQSEKIKKEKTKVKNRNIYLSYNERQRAKIYHQNDAERIRELNLLSTNESKFMRLLQYQFTEHKIIIKDKRFYIADQDYYPIAIFEYRDGTKELKVKDNEDGIPVFLYKAILSSESILEDKLSLNIG